MSIHNLFLCTLVKLLIKLIRHFPKNLAPEAEKSMPSHRNLLNLLSICLIIFVLEQTCWSNRREYQTTIQHLLDVWICWSLPSNDKTFAIHELILTKIYRLQGCNLIAYSFKQFVKLDLVCYPLMISTIFDSWKLWLFKFSYEFFFFFSMADYYFLNYELCFPQPPFF